MNDENTKWYTRFIKWFGRKVNQNPTYNVKISVQQLHNIRNNYNINIPVQEIPEHSVNITNIYPSTKYYEILTMIEIRTVMDYTSKKSLYINKYLYDNIIINVENNTTNYIKTRFPIKKDETLEQYEKRIAYYYFVNLYNAIQKAPPLHIMHPFIVYRGTNKLYMKKNKDIYYYNNSFTSTSQSKTIAQTFSKKYIYVYYIHPKCRYIPISDELTHVSYEREIILAPYQRYLFIKKDTTTNNQNISFVYYHYVILPTDLSIPTTFETFEIWKNKIHELSSLLVGGRLNKNITYKNRTPAKTQTNNKMGNLLQKINIFRKKEETLLMDTFYPPKAPSGSYNVYDDDDTLDDFSLKTQDDTPIRYDPRERFCEPIPSFPGKAPTAHEQKVINDMLHYFGVTRAMDHEELEEST